MSTPSDDMRKYSWFPTVKYQVGDETIEKRFDYGNAKPKYKEGQKVEIYYNPQKPEDFYISGEKVQQTVGRVFTMVGWLLLVIDIIVVIISAIIK